MDKKVKKPVSKFIKSRLFHQINESEAFNPAGQPDIVHVRYTNGGFYIGKQNKEE